MACGYSGHVCGYGKVQFISRYCGENDYCVDGIRIGISDDGFVHWHGQTPSQEIVDRILLFELDEYSEYIRLRAESKSTLGSVELQPFGHPVIRV